MKKIDYFILISIMIFTAVTVYFSFASFALLSSRDMYCVEMVFETSSEIIRSPGGIN